MTHAEASDYGWGNYYKSGIAAGNIEKLLIGAPAPLCKPPKRDTSKDDQSAPGQFVAGWLYGIIPTMDERDYIMDCYQPNDMLTSFLYSAWEHYFAGDEALGDAMMHCTRPLYESALSKCDKDGTVLDVLGKLDQYYVKWESQPKASELKKKNYEANKEEVDKDFGYMQKTWTEGIPFNTGMFAGQVQVLLEGKPELELGESFLN